MDIENVDWSLLLLVGVILILLFWGMRLKWREISRKQTVVRQLRKGLEAEKSARKLLHHWGYTILEEQYPLQHLYHVNGKEVKVDLAVDFLVSKGGQRFLVEVKAGRKVGSSEFGPTRRQLLEYFHLMDTDGLLLLDMENQKLMDIQFFPKRETPPSLFPFWMVWLMGIAVIYKNSMWLNLAYALLFFLVLIWMSQRKRNE